MNKILFLILFFLNVSLADSNTSIISFQIGNVTVTGIEKASEKLSHTLSVSIEKLTESIDKLAKSDKLTENDKKRLIELSKSANLALNDFRITLKKMEKPTKEMIESSIKNFFDHIPMKLIKDILLYIFGIIAVFSLVLVIIVFFLDKIFNKRDDSMKELAFEVKKLAIIIEKHNKTLENK